MQSTIVVLEGFQDRDEAGEPKYDGTIRALAEALRLKLEKRGIGQAEVYGGPETTGVENRRVSTLEVMRDANSLIQLLGKKGHVDETKELRSEVDEWAGPSKGSQCLRRAA